MPGRKAFIPLQPVLWDLPAIRGRMPPVCSPWACTFTEPAGRAVRAARASPLWTHSRAAQPLHSPWLPPISGAPQWDHKADTRLTGPGRQPWWQTSHLSHTGNCPHCPVQLAPSR